MVGFDAIAAFDVVVLLTVVGAITFMLLFPPEFDLRIASNAAIWKLVGRADSIFPMFEPRGTPFGMAGESAFGVKPFPVAQFHKDLKKSFWLSRDLMTSS